MIKFFHILGLLVAVSTSHLPIALLHVGVWVSMFDEFYNETQSIAISTQWTFDGEHRCQGCELVNGIASGDQQNLPLQESLTKDVKLGCIETDHLVLIQASFSKRILFESQSGWPLREGVKLPPPRLPA
jgi:hypothetical protein